MLEAVKDIPGEDVIRGRTRVSHDHRLAHAYPGAFKEATDGPTGEARWSTPVKAECSISGGKPPRRSTRPRHQRPPLEVEDRVRRETLARIDREARDRDREPTPEERFWASTQGYLSSIEDPVTRQRRAQEQREDAEQQETLRLIAQQARAEVDEICRDWREWSAPWN
jgi:hypothetical protein